MTPPSRGCIIRPRILLPDATVLSLGGGAPGPLTNLNGEIYKPSYLFNADGSLATRPVITDAPQSIEQQQEFYDYGG